MTQVFDLIKTLKRELRRRGITYAGLAVELGLSESSVKRMFAAADFNLSRLQQICDILALDLGDLAARADEERRDVEELSEEQEQSLVDNPKLLLVAFLLLNHWDTGKITKFYRIGELEAVRLLAKLDRLKIIDLLPGNKVRMRLSRTFDWRRHGPIERFFESQVQTEFFRSHFDGPGELRVVLNGMVSNQSLGLIQQRMQRLGEEFERCAREDRKLMESERLGTTLVMAIRPWALSMFEQFRR